MSVLVVGLSHRSAPVAVLERLALDADGLDKLARRAVDTPYITEASVIATCNRIEVYVATDRFHGSVEDLTSVLLEVGGLRREEVVRHLYVHYDDAAVAHLFEVASGLDSMVVGESQILGQVRAALQRGQEHETVGTALNVLFQQALRVGKRGHAETGIDRAAPSVVSAALDHVERTGLSWPGARVLVVGAGAMAGLAVALLARRGADAVTVVNRSYARAERLAAGVDGRVADWDSLDAKLASADVVVTCTGATGTVLTADAVQAALRARAEQGAPGPLVLVDLAMPRDVEPGVEDLPGVVLVGLAELADGLQDAPVALDVRQVRGIVAAEVRAFLSARSAALVTPTVVALRTMATGVVEREVERLVGRRPDLDEATRADITQAMRRVADKLIHPPTVRIKELAGDPQGVTYADALAELFSLDAGAVDAIARPGLTESPEDPA